MKFILVLLLLFNLLITFTYGVQIEQFSDTAAEGTRNGCSYTCSVLVTGHQINDSLTFMDLSSSTVINAGNLTFIGISTSPNKSIYQIKFLRNKATYGNLSIQVTDLTDSTSAQIMNFYQFDCGSESQSSNFLPLPGYRRYNYQDIYLTFSLEDYNIFATFDVSESPGSGDLAVQYISTSGNVTFVGTIYNPAFVLSEPVNSTVTSQFGAVTLGSFNLTNYFKPENGNSNFTSTQFYPTIASGALLPQAIRQVYGTLTIINATDDSWAGFYDGSYPTTNTLFQTHYAVNRNVTAQTTSVIMLYNGIFIANVNFLPMRLDGSTMNMVSSGGTSINMNIPYAYSVSNASSWSTPAVTVNEPVFVSFIIDYQFSNAIDDARCFSYISTFGQVQTQADSTNGLIYPNATDFTISHSALIPKALNGYFGVTTGCINNIRSNNPQTFYQTSIIGTDSTAPSITSIQFKTLANRKLLAQVSITDDISGVFLVVFKSSTQLVRLYASEHIVSGGTFLNGEFDFILDLDGYTSIDVYDAASNTKNIPINSIVNAVSQLSVYPVPLPYFPNLVVGLTNITFIQLINPVMNASVGNLMNNSLFLGFDGITSDLCVYIQFDLPFGPGATKFYGEYNNDLNLFIIPFTIPNNVMPSTLHYDLTINYNTIPSMMLYSLYPTSELTITTDIGDYMPPVISSITFLPSSSIFVSVDTNATIQFVIKDSYGGFKEGYVIVQSSVNREGKRYDLTPSMATGDQFEGTYQITIPLSAASCIPQSYYISGAYLVDEHGYTASSLDFGDTMFNPLYLLYSTDTSYPKLSVTCEVTITGILPTLSTFITSASSMNVFASNRDIHFNVSLSTRFGISNNKLPFINLMTTTRDIYTISCTAANSTVTYTYPFVCVGSIPYGFGYPDGLLISISNVASKTLYTTSFTSIYLKNAGLPYFIQTNRTNPAPYLTYVSPYDPNTDMITISGVSFTQDATLTFNNATVSQTLRLRDTQASPSVELVPGTQSLFTITGISDLIDSSTNGLSLTVTTAQGDSNTVSFNQLVPKTKLPLAVVGCQGNPQCGGPAQGVCNGDAGCDCIYPWAGVDCSSKRLVVEQGTMNISNPQYYSLVQNNNNDMFKILVQITALREVNYLGNVVNTLNLNMADWDHEVDPSGNIYYFYYEFDHGGLTTQLNATVQYYSKETTQEFGGQKFEIYPSTYKYRVTLTNYAFQTQLNKLQLIFSSMIETTSTDQCSTSSSGVGNSGDSSYQYSKAQVKDMSIYGRFLQFGILDGATISLSNDDVSSEFAKSNTVSSQESYVAINIPHYKVIALLDPDFSVLLDYTPASSNNDPKALCNGSNSKKSGLTTAQLIGIIVGAVLFFIIITTIILFFVYKKYRYSKTMLSLRSKL